MTVVERQPVTGALAARPRAAAVLRPGPVVVAVLLAGALHLAWWQLLASSGGDIAAQDAWALKQRDRTTYDLTMRAQADKLRQIAGDE